MNELIKIDKSGKTTARELYEFLSPDDKSHYSRWAKTNIEENEFYSVNTDWWGFATMANGNEVKDYQLTIEFSKHLCMLSRTERGKQARNYFVEVEKRYKTLSAPETLSIQSKAKNAEARLLNAKRKDAEFLLMVAKQHDTLSPESRELLTINAVERLTGEGFLPRPKVDKLYTATEIGKELDISANMVGRIANANNLKTSEYGILVLDKSKHSVKQVDTFMYREAGKEEIIRLFKKMNVS